MRILQINNTDFEGSVYNGHDLQISLNKVGVDTEELVLYKRTDSEKAHSFCTEQEILWQQQYNIFESSTGMLNLFAPFGYKIISARQFLDADIVHFQLIHNHVLSLPTFAAMCQMKPSVWTLHDLWAFTGHCIHPLECDGWKDSCYNCPKLEDPFFSLKYPKASELWKIKDRIYKQINPDIVVASEYTKRYIEQSPLMHHFTHIHKIPFGMDVDCIKSFDKENAKADLGIPIENIVISFRLNKSKLKGVCYLVSALERMKQMSVTVLAVDVGDSSMLDTLRSKYQVLELGTQDKEGMAKFYQATDIFVMPSLAESFGLMAIEAMAYKCTVVVFDNTVLPEITFAPECGVSVPFLDVEALGAVLDHLVISPEERAKRGEIGQKLVRKNYRYEDYVKKHIDLYNDIYDRVNKKKYQMDCERILENDEKMGREVERLRKRTATFLNKLHNLGGGHTIKICLFCAGRFAEKGFEILVRNGLIVDYVADNDPLKWGYWGHGLNCISREQLKLEKDIVLVIVTNKVPDPIEQELVTDGFPFIINYYQLEKIDQEVSEIYGEDIYSKIAQLNYSDEGVLDLIDFMNKRICDISRYYQEQIAELNLKAFEAKPVKAIAMYLPQFHETEENNKWWGKGFTEWTSVRNGQSLFKGHYQPHIPLEENYYNLLDRKTMEWQVQLAKDANIFGFCFYHYWFKDGKRTLEKPAENLLKWGDLDIHFCFSWANESWIRSWSNVKGGNAWVNEENNTGKSFGDENGILLEQKYGGKREWEEHFNYLLPFFRDKRYVTIDGKPVFMIYRPELVDCLDDMIAFWRKLAVNNDLPGLYIICANCGDNKWSEVDARYIQEFNYSYSIDVEPTVRAISWEKGVLTYDYDVLWENIINRKYNSDEKVFLGACVDFDCTPRHGMKGNLTVGGTPLKFQKYFGELCKKSIRRNNEFVFINAWNEWGEGMHLEPDKKNGYAYLDAVREALITANKKYLELSAETDAEKSIVGGVSQEQYDYAKARVEKFKDYFNLFDKWFTAKEKKLDTEYMFLKKGLQNVALYGVGKVGRHLIFEIKNTRVNICYLLDRKLQTDRYLDIPIYALNKNLPLVDAVIVTAVFDFDNIARELERYFNCPIISLQEIFE